MGASCFRMVDGTCVCRQPARNGVEHIGARLLKMVRNQARIEHVRNMRLAAGECMVALCREVAGRELVAEMMARTRPSSGTASAKADAERAYKLYEATFEGHEGLPSPLVSNSY